MNQAGNGADSDALVFVYGSLKRGMAAHGQLEGACWRGAATLPGFALYDLGPFPMAIPCSEPGCAIRGECFAVHAALLEQLDRFEGVPRLYARQCHVLANGLKAWVYVGRTEQVRHVQRVADGCWKGPDPHFKRRGRARY
jgi:gamma-glutamylcyclotransferase (GGCT)/AIG2-like uncharacterized protein YtfP